MREARPNSCSASSGRTVRSRPTIAADEGVDEDEQRELPRIGTEPQLDCRGCGRVGSTHSNSLRRPRRDLVAQRPPVGHALLQTPGAETMGAQDLERAQRKDAVRTPTVGDDLLPRGKLGEPTLELIDRDREQTGMCPDAYSSAGRTSSTTTSSDRMSSSNSSTATGARAPDSSK